MAEKLCPHCGKPIDSAPDDEGFIEFWTLYPVHKAKKVAARSWRRLPRKHKDQALEHLRRRPFAESDKQYVPHPSTYLNQERWNDEDIKPAEPTIFGI